MICVHYTKLPDLPPNHTFLSEWATYGRKMPHWLADGQEGRFVLIKGDEVIGIWDTWREAFDTARERLGLIPFMVHQILEWESALNHRYL